MWQQSLKVQGNLSYEKVQDGMVILSCVRHISNLTVQLEFPGLIYGTLNINHITDTFSNIVSQHFKTGNEEFYSSTLKRILKMGQLMPAKILSNTKTEKGHVLQCTVNPKSINQDKKHNSFKKGEIIWANVVSELDHGYQLTLGVNNCRVFLPFKNTDNLKKYEIGEPLYCVVHKVASCDFITTLTVSSKIQHLNSCQTNELSLNAVLPGMKVNFLVEEILPAGVKGEFFDKCFGFIDNVEMFMAVKNKNLKEASTVKASVLYVEPITKITYLTLRDLENLTQPQFEPGKIISAEVTVSGRKGLYLQLGKNIGFVTNKRLLNTIERSPQIDVIQTIRSKYPVGSHHDCRILDYNYLQQLYICTFEKQLVKEKIFSAKDLTIGQVVKVTVDRVISAGLVIKIGNLKGFVPNIHISNGKYTEKIKEKFSIGMKTVAKVLKFTTKDHVVFTLKQSLIESEQCLSQMEDAIPNSQYLGCVVQTKVAGALVTFYGSAKGWLSKKTLNRGNSGRFVDPRDFFFTGQVVKVWNVGNNMRGKLQLSLKKPSLRKEKNVQVDQVVTQKNTVKEAEAFEEEQAEASSDEEEAEVYDEEEAEASDEEEAGASDEEEAEASDEEEAEASDEEEAEASDEEEAEASDEEEAEASDEEEAGTSDEEEAGASDEEAAGASDEEEAEASAVEGTGARVLCKSPDNKNSDAPHINKPVLSGSHSFYTMVDEDMEKNDSSEEDESSPNKKIKLSAADELSKREAIIRQRESQSSNLAAVPQSAEEFNKLLLRNPNSSVLWGQYISMHVMATELDKARTVAKRAIETMTLVQEKLNIWIVLINLELKYGTQESFEKVFQEAVKCNDKLDIYLSVIKILGTSGKSIEMEEKIKMLRAQEKQNTKMWLEVGRIYYSLQKFKEARNLKEAAVKSILDKRNQFDIILRFAVMEFQLGDVEHAITTFETVLDTYPSKVNIWIIYVDQLVKQKDFGRAREVLEKAINQKFSAKTMKTLFQKFIRFEKEHGTSEMVEKVKNLAKEYVISCEKR